MTRFQRPISASTKARQLYPDAFCQPMRPCLAIACRCRSRGHAEWAHSPRLARHATQTRWHNDRGIGMAGSDLAVDYIWISEGIEILASEVCFDRPSPDDPSLWPSDHAGVWADLQI